MLPGDAVDQDTPEERIAELVDAVKRDPRHRDRLVELLPERLPLYTGRSANATARMRGYITAAFEQVGLPDAALPYVLEELETGNDAYLVAAAASALRGLDHPTGQAVPFLLRALENMRYADDAVSFDSYRPRWPLPRHTTATEEIMKTFAWLGPAARSALPALAAWHEDRTALSPTARATLDAVMTGLRDADGCGCGCGGGGGGAEEACGCCAPPIGPEVTAASSTPTRAAVPAGVELEDQEGRPLTFGGFFSGKPSVVVFFYTRCDNPRKCSLTIAKLAGLQRALREEGLAGRVRTAAITYDPGYDLPPRLSAYGQNRGVVFGDDDRFLRTTAELTALQEYFALGVNFGQALVNRHRIELFLLDHEGRIAGTFTRLQWDVQKVLDQARGLVRPDHAHHP